MLHRRRYRETSLIVDFLTAEQGRVSAVARGALRRGASLAMYLQPQILLSLEMRGRGDLLTLIRAEPNGRSVPALTGERLYSLFYINELVTRLTISHDPNAELFNIYRTSLARLGEETSIELVLRHFETRFLDAIGLGLVLTVDSATGLGVESAIKYQYLAERGPVRAGVDRQGISIHGSTLHALADGTEMNLDQLREAKRLMRYLLDHHLEGHPLLSRKLFGTNSNRNS